MRLIINTVNLKVGGAFQRSISFLKELKEIGKDEYHVFLNEDISKQIDIKSYSSNFYFYHFNHSPASLRHRTRILRRFNSLEDEIKPDVIFSFVGPCYWRAKSPHLVGFGVPHIVYDDYKYVKKFSFKLKLINKNSENLKISSSFTQSSSSSYARILLYVWDEQKPLKDYKYKNSILFKY